MTCPRHEDLSAYADDMMPVVERQRFAEHLAGCPACRGRLSDLAALRQSLRELPSPALGFDLAARLGERLRPVPARQRPIRRPLWSGWSGWAPAGVSAVLALASGVWLGGLLVGGAAGAPPATGTMRVFDPIPPGGLCAAPELCRISKGFQ